MAQLKQKASTIEVQVGAQYEHFPPAAMVTRAAAVSPYPKVVWEEGRGGRDEERKQLHHMGMFVLTTYM